MASSKRASLALAQTGGLRVQVLSLKNDLLKIPYEAADGKPVRVTMGLRVPRFEAPEVNIDKLAAIFGVGGSGAGPASPKVRIVTIDNYRIGAMEQIKAYAKILGIPCYPAVNRRDLDFVLRKLNGKDVILIDTAGQSHGSGRQDRLGAPGGVPLARGHHRRGGPDEP